jgi:hypothetical protein
MFLTNPYQTFLSLPLKPLPWGQSPGWSLVTRCQMHVGFGANVRDIDVSTLTCHDKYVEAGIGSQDPHGHIVRQNEGLSNHTHCETWRVLCCGSVG